MNKNNNIGNELSKQTVGAYFRNIAKSTLIAASLLESILMFQGCTTTDKRDEVIGIKKGTAIERFYAQKHSSNKKVFVYDQGLNSDVLEHKVLANADYVLPHLFDFKIHTFNLVQFGTKKSNKKDKKGNFITIPNYKKIPLIKHVDLNNVPILKSNLDELVNNARRDSVYIAPMVSAFDDDVIKEILASPHKYATLIADKIKSLPVQGVSIDFENVKIDSTYSAKLVNFMKILRNDLPAPYKISIAVSPRFAKSSKKGFPHHGFYDYKELAKYVDNINLMCYDFHKGRIGPSQVLPEDMFLKVLDYAKENIPKDQITPILPLYGYVWMKTKNGFKPKGTLSSVNEEIYSRKNIISSKYINGEHRIETKDRIIYEQNAKTINRRLNLLDKDSIYNVGAWRANHGSDKVYSSINSWKRLNR